MLRNMLAGSRYLIIIAVIGTALMSIVTLIYGGLIVLSVIFEMFTHAIFTADGAKHLAVECIEIIDLFLLGTVLYIVALGLYDLFIDESLVVPNWLMITSLDDLKDRLLGIIIVLLAVTFLGNVVAWDGTTTILALGIAIGFVLFALGFFVSLRGRHRPPVGPNDTKTQG